MCPTLPVTPADATALARAFSRLGGWLVGRQKERDAAAFNELLSEVIAKNLGVYGRLESMTPVHLQRAITETMRAINDVVFFFHAKKRRSPYDQLTINSCYMVPVFPSDASSNRLDQVRFLGGGGRTRAKELAAILLLGGWADSVASLPSSLVLPVEQPEDPNFGHRLLFGAPRALVLNQIQVINDTLNPTRRPRALSWVKDGRPSPGRFYLQPSLPDDVCGEITRYFRDKQDHVRSFASIPLAAPDDTQGLLGTEYGRIPIGVLNIQSNRPKVLGPMREWQHLLSRMEPLLHILAGYLTRARAISAKAFLEA